MSENQPETSAPDGPVDDITVPIVGPDDITLEGLPDADPMMTGETARSLAPEVDDEPDAQPDSA